MVEKFDSVPLDVFSEFSDLRYEILVLTTKKIELEQENRKAFWDFVNYKIRKIMNLIECPQLRKELQKIRFAKGNIDKSDSIMALLSLSDKEYMDLHYTFGDNNNEFSYQRNLSLFNHNYHKVTPVKTGEHSLFNSGSSGLF